MDMEALLNSRQAGMFALWLSRSLPPVLGYKLAGTIAAWIASNRKADLFQALRANHWVIGKKASSARQLDQKAQATLSNITRSFYTLFHYLGNVQKIQDKIVYSLQAEEIIVQSRKKERGLLILGVHMCFSDLILQSAAQRGLRGLALSLPQPADTVEWQHNYRRKAGVEILPASVKNIRLVIQRLAAKETVITGLDRPIPEAKYRPCFFGYPANVPVHYIPVALKADVPVVVMAIINQADGNYYVKSSEIFSLKTYQDREKELLCNAEMVLEIATDFIRQAPQQWSVTQPVWPDLMAEVPQ
jgi:KDO2-lipid IV(A) lauroyltransferase